MRRRSTRWPGHWSATTKSTRLAIMPRLPTHSTRRMARQFACWPIWTSGAGDFERAANRLTAPSQFESQRRRLGPAVRAGGSLRPNSASMTMRGPRFARPKAQLAGQTADHLRDSYFIRRRQWELTQSVTPADLRRWRQAGDILDSPQAHCVSHRLSSLRHDASRADHCNARRHHRHRRIRNPPAAVRRAAGVEGQRRRWTPSLNFARSTWNSSSPVGNRFIR